MPAFEVTRRVPFTPEQMFALVADIELYPLFLPLCEAIEIKSRGQAGAIETVVAAMTVGYGAIRESFVSRVTLDRAAATVAADLVEGPFRMLENRWAFLPAAGGCEIRFSVAYEFKSLMLQMLVGAMFDKAVRRYTEAFEDRARVVYGRPNETRPVS